MNAKLIITNDRQAREVSATLARIEEALSSEQALKAIVDGLPREATEGIRRSLTTEHRELLDAFLAYENGKKGNFEPLRLRAGRDPGALLIVARLIKNWSQRDLAERLGLREQAIQRWESERYRSSSLSNFLKVAKALGAHISAEFAPAANDLTPTYEIPQSEIEKVVKHAIAHRWLETVDGTEKGTANQLKRYVIEHVSAHGTPSLLRTGLNVTDHSEDWVLLSWKAQVTRVAKEIIENEKIKYRPLDLAWLIDLVHLSTLKDGPVKAKQLLKLHGILLIVEPHIAGMAVDGAAFLIDEIPVIGLTLRKDSVDNFWFTLVHEVAHVILHFRTGLASGFFDDVEHADVDEFEEEANRFARNLLIPEELWSRSPARVAKSPEPIERLAKQLGIAPEIIFGRIRMERNNYALFSDRIGNGQIRKQFFLPKEASK